MPSKQLLVKLESGCFYHIYNRGNNRENIFYSNENYIYFLNKFDQYLSKFIELLSYCLMPNHFHFLIKVIDRDSIPSRDGIPVNDLISEQFRKFFISYSQAINKQENRTGSLFSKNFKRVEVQTEEQLKLLVFYIHSNPQKHFPDCDFKKYPYSSYHAICSDKQTKVNRDYVIKMFEGKDKFLEFHNQMTEYKKSIGAFKDDY